MTTTRHAQARGLLPRLAALLVMCMAGTATADESKRYIIDWDSLPLCVRVDCGNLWTIIFGGGPQMTKVPEVLDLTPDIDLRTSELHRELAAVLEERHVETVFALNAAITEQDPAQVREAMEQVHAALALELEQYPEESFEGVAEGGLLLCLDEECLERLPPGVRPYATVVQDFDLAELAAGRLYWESTRHLPKLWPPCIVIDCGWTGPALLGRGPMMERLPQLLEQLPELDEPTLNFQATLFTALEERHQEKLLFFREALGSRDPSIIHDALVQLDAAILEEVTNMDEVDMSGAAEGGAFLCYDTCDGIPPWILPYVRNVNELDLGGLSYPEVLNQLTN